jgi:electron transfer flavoprotein beta subunit
VEIVVLLKQVPDTETSLQIGADGASVRTEEVKWIINPYDELAVEEALRIKESQGGGKVTILTVGQERAVESIRTALAMGADEGILVNDPALNGADGISIAKVLAAALADVPFDLVIASEEKATGEKDPDGYRRISGHGGA